MCIVFPYPWSPRQTFPQGESFAPLPSGRTTFILVHLDTSTIALVCIFSSQFEPQLGKSEEFNNHGMKKK